MYESVYEALNNHFSNYKIEVRKQNRSIGITFYENEFEVHFDVVPGREINDFKNDKELNLLDNANSFWNGYSRIKTNLDAHKVLTVNKPEERKVIKLIKLYRDRNDLEMPSIVIQSMVSRCFDKKLPSSSIMDNFTYAMEYMANKLPSSRIVDPANTNNIISDSIDQERIRVFTHLVNNDLYKINEDERYIKEAFS